MKDSFLYLLVYEPPGPAVEGCGEGRRRAGKDEGFSSLESTRVLRNSFTARRLWPMPFLNIPVLNSSQSSLLLPSASPCAIPLLLLVFIPHGAVDYGRVPC